MSIAQFAEQGDGRLLDQGVLGEVGVGHVATSSARSVLADVDVEVFHVQLTGDQFGQEEVTGVAEVLHFVFEVHGCLQHRPNQFVELSVAVARRNSEGAVVEALLNSPWRCRGLQTFCVACLYESIATTQQ